MPDTKKKSKVKTQKHSGGLLGGAMRGLSNRASRIDAAVNKATGTKKKKNKKNK